MSSWSRPPQATTSAEDGNTMRDFTRRLFGRKPEADEATDPPPSRNKVPHEGRHVEQPGDDEHDMREFTAVLFGRSSTIHEIH